MFPEAFHFTLYSISVISFVGVLKLEIVLLVNNVILRHIEPGFHLCLIAFLIEGRLFIDQKLQLKINSFKRQFSRCLQTSFT